MTNGEHPSKLRSKSEEVIVPWQANPGAWHGTDAAAILIWTVAVILVFGDAAILRGALFYFDITEINYPYRDFVAREFREGRFSRWMPGLYNGMPLFSESQAGYLHPSKLLYLFLPTWIAFNVDTIGSVWLTGLASYGWLRRHLGIAGALTGAALMGFGGYTWAHLVHTSMINALISVPLALWALEWSWSRGGRRAQSLGALALAAQVFAGHLQDALMTMMVVCLYAIYRSAVERSWGSRLASIRPALTMVTLAVAVSAVQWLPSKALIDRSPRAGGLSYQEATFGSWHPELLPTMFVREAYGTRARDTDWMDGFYPYHEMDTCFGVLGISLAALGAGAFRNRWVAFWIILVGLSLVLMLGKFTSVWDVFYGIPILGSGRIPVRYHLWMTIAIAALAGVGVDRLSRPGIIRLRGAISLIGLMVAISIPLLVVVYLPVWTEADRWTWTYHRNRFNWLGWELAIASARTVLLAVVGLGLALRIRKTTDPRLRTALAGFLPVLVLVELLASHWYDVPTVDPGYWTQPPATARWLLSNPDVERIYGLGDRSVGEPGYASEPVNFFPARDTLSRSLAPVWGLRSSGGHTPIIPSRISEYDEAANRAGVRFDLEAVTHILMSRRSADSSRGEPIEIGSALIYHNPNAQPRARLVGRPIYVKDSLAAQAALLSLGRDSRHRIVVEDPDQPISPEAETSGTVEIVEDRPEHVVARVEAESPGYLVLADTFDPGWSATLDGKPAVIRPAYITFRAVLIPAGSHEVVFTYRPEGFSVGLAITMMSLVGIVIGLLRPGECRILGELDGQIEFPVGWQWVFAVIIVLIMVSSVLTFGPGGSLSFGKRWEGSLHRFTWGAGIEALRPRTETVQ